MDRRIDVFTSFISSMKDCEFNSYVTGLDVKRNLKSDTYIFYKYYQLMRNTNKFIMYINFVANTDSIMFMIMCHIFKLFHQNEYSFVFSCLKEETKKNLVRYKEIIDHLMSSNDCSFNYHKKSIFIILYDYIVGIPSTVYTPQIIKV